MPRVILRSAEFATLSPKSCKLLLDLLAQFRGDNNGDLCAAWTLMKPRGWRSKGQLSKAIKELCNADFLVVTRRGGKHKATLYGVTFFAIDWCGAKLDIKSPSREFMGSWRRLPPDVVALKPVKPALSLPRPEGQLPENCPAQRVNSEAAA